MTSTRRQIILEGIENLKRANEIAVPLKTHRIPEIAELAKAIHFASFGAQQIGLGLADEGRVNDLPS